MYRKHAASSSQPRRVAGQSASAASTTTGAKNATQRPLVSHGGKGGGSLRSIGESFKVNPVNGSFSLSLPIATTAGRSGFGPSLRLDYDSGSGNGAFGLGWNLALDTISRKTSKNIPKYRQGGAEEDVYVLSQADDLVPSMVIEDVRVGLTPNANFIVQTYRLRTENTPMTIQRWTQQENHENVHWRTITADNVTTLFGDSDASRVSEKNADESKRIFQWLPTYRYDAWGNAMIFEYKTEDSVGVSSFLCEARRDDTSRGRARYLKRIKYGNRVPNRNLDDWVATCAPSDWLFEVVFDYGEHDLDKPSPREQNPWPVRQDPYSSYKSGFEVRHYRLCRRVLMFHHIPEKLTQDDVLVNSTTFSYQESSSFAYLTGAQVSGHSLQADKTYATEQLPRTSLEYSHTKVTDATTLQNICKHSVPVIPGTSQLRADWIDLNGEGAPGILTKQSDLAFTYQRNQSDESGPRFSEPALLGSCPNLDKVEFYFDDLDKNGVLQAVILNDAGIASGFYDRQNGGWSDHRAFIDQPLTSQNLETHKIDLTGSGTSDLLSIDPAIREIVWSESKGTAGFSHERRVQCPGSGPFFIQGDALSMIYMADMSGDGLTDLVLIGNGWVSYWPNLGYGNFGQEVVMDWAPRLDNDESFNHRRLLLADIDGSGTTDIVYILPGGGITLCYNQAGNSWGTPVRLPAFPDLEGNHTSAMMLDILANGTSCLCWFGADVNSIGEGIMNYIDFSGGVKPHLMLRHENGMGLSTTVTYRPSTWYSRQDDREGQPWLTKLPFPSQCVQTTTTHDAISSRTLTKTYRYHDGFFDGPEGEFRGFASIETWSQEQFYFDSPNQISTPVTYVKSWYANGAVDIGMGCLRPYATRSLPQHKFPPLMNEDFHRALKGSPLLEETYDSSNKIPFSSTETCFEVEILQSSTQQSPPVLRVIPRETLTTLYEQSSESPRRSHNLNLNVNQFGDVLQTVSVVYGKPESLLTNPVDQRAQTDTFVSYRCNTFTNEIRHSRGLRKPLPTTSNSYNTNVSRDKLFTLEELLKDETNLIRLCDSMEFDQNLSKSIVLDSATKVLYRSNDMTKFLPRGVLEEFSTSGQSFTLAHTTTTLAPIVENLQTSQHLGLAAVLQEGGYIQLDKTNTWWIPSETAHFGSEDAAELKTARRMFYQPTVSLNAFGSSATKTLDEFSMMVVKTIDAVGNTTQAEHDYISMQPRMLIDENDNITHIMHDALGRGIGKALLGKAAKEADSIEDFERYPKLEAIQEFLRHPDQDLARQLLGQATSRTVYVPFGQYVLEQETIVNPALEVVLHRESHFHPAGPDARVQMSFAYLDGSGQVFQQFQNATGLDKSSSWRRASMSIMDSAGHALRTFRPTYTTSHLCTLVSPSNDRAETTRFYDVLGREVATVNSDHTWTTNQFNCWSKISHDAGDTIALGNIASVPWTANYSTKIDSASYSCDWLSNRGAIARPTQQQQRAVQQSNIYANTPVISHYDARGSDIVKMEMAGPRPIVTRTIFDLHHRPVKLFDALDREVERIGYDVLHRPIVTANMDSGKVCGFHDIDGKPVLAWNSRRTRTHIMYDALRRPITTRSMVSRDVEKLTQIMEYGEQIHDAVSSNLKGKLVTVKDQSGVTVYDAYDFKGNCLRTSRQFATEYRETLDWSKEISIEDKRFVTTKAFDALNRSVSLTDHEGNITEHTYNSQGLLQQVSCTTSQDQKRISYMSDVVYTADDKPVVISYANETKAMLEYDELTRSLTRERLLRRNGDPLHDKRYTYDCMNRMVHVQDSASDTEFFRNNKVTNENWYSYDATGRLVQADGREQCTKNNSFRAYQAALPTMNQTTARDSDGMFAYIERYEYDDADNILKMSHEPRDAGVGLSGWTRRYTYEEASLLEPTKVGNRLSQTQVGKVSETYGYMEEGMSLAQMTSMPGFSSLSWDAQDRLRSSSTQNVNSGTPGTTWYVYDYTGERVRKVTDATFAVGEVPSPVKETFYLPGHEILVRYGGAEGAELERTSSVHVMGTNRIAIIERKQSAPTCLVRYQPNERTELDDSGNVVSYQEHSPFGSITYVACGSDIEAPSKYRFAAYERDTETGFYFCKARYLAPWLGRWISADPIGVDDGMNVFAYVRNDPINYDDPGGTCREGTNTSPATKQDESTRPKTTKSGNYIRIAKVTYLRPTGSPETQPEQKSSSKEKTAAQKVATKNDKTTSKAAPPSKSNVNVTQLRPVPQLAKAPQLSQSQIDTPRQEANWRGNYRRIGRVVDEELERLSGTTLNSSAQNRITHERKRNEFLHDGDMGRNTPYYKVQEQLDKLAAGLGKIAQHLPDDADYQRIGEVKRAVETLADRTPYTDDLTKRFGLRKLDHGDNVELSEAKLTLQGPKAILTMKDFQHKIRLQEMGYQVGTRWKCLG